MNYDKFDGLYEIASHCINEPWADSLLSACKNLNTLAAMLVRSAFSENTAKLEADLEEFKKSSRQIVTHIEERINNPENYKIIVRPPAVEKLLKGFLFQYNYREAGKLVQARGGELPDELLFKTLVEFAVQGYLYEGSWRNLLYFIRCMATEIHKRNDGAAKLAKVLEKTVLEEVREVALILIKVGADVNAVDGTLCFDTDARNVRCSLLHAAAKKFNGRQDICEAIIKAGHSVDAIDAAGVPVIEYFPASARQDWADEYFAQVRERQIRKATPKSKTKSRKSSSAKSI